MSGIFGLVRLDGAPILDELFRMRDAMSHWGPDGVRLWSSGSAGLGQCLLWDTPECVFETLPSISCGGSLAFTAEARIDNRDELFGALGIAGAERTTMADGEVVRRAYERWGVDCAPKLLGDWSFAAWHPAERRLCLARDHCGNTSVYYFNDGRQVAFASDRRAILALNGIPRRLNDLYIAQLLVAWPAYHGDDTIYEGIQRLAPAHAMFVTAGSERRWRYWRLEDVPEVRLASAADYAEALRGHLQEAVHARVRSVLPITSALSGGLDSGSVTVSAARDLATTGRGVLALTSVPLFGTPPIPGTVADEFPLAAATARMARNIDHRAIDAREMGPLDGLEQALAIHGEPVHATANYYWILALLAAARGTVLLTGQTGNGGLSWAGVPGFSDVGVAFRHGGSWRAARVAVRTAATSVPVSRCRAWWRALRAPSGQPWRRYSAIQRHLADRVRLLERMAAAGHDPTFTLRPRDPREAQLKLLRPGRNIIGVVWSELGAAGGLTVRDPCQDIRLISFSLGVPNHLWRGPLNRWLVREATKGLLPDEVRLAVKQGLQGVDIGQRLRLQASRLESLLQELEASDAANWYVDVAYIRAVARGLIANDGTVGQRSVVSILQRCLAVGLFVARRAGAC
jgi:asparagine synthase (glutamine-hydrolysing)